MGSVVARRSLPSREIRIGVWGAMWLTRSASVKEGVQRFCVAGLRAPAVSFQTT